MNSIEKLMKTLRYLPGVGPKSAQRITYQLLTRKKDEALELSKALMLAVERVRYCKYCQTLTESEICKICSDSRREKDKICIVENPIDITLIEQTGNYRGLYFVLMGHLSPLDGIGPSDIGMDKLKERLQGESFEELILAMNSTVEGEATAYYIANLVKDTDIKCTKIAQGISMGSELEYIDTNTMSRAFTGRIDFHA